MKLLLDTHVVLWWFELDARLGRHALARLDDPANNLILSIASLWEIAIKHGAGKLESSAALIASRLHEARVAMLQVGVSHLTAYEQLPMRHRDPFDRLILAQALVEGANIMTNDAAIRQYGVPCTDTD
jgi:PIN domain nuclease of toxin-antitoxin system